MVDSYKYLGLEINSSSIFSKSKEVLSKPSSISLGRLIHKYYSVDGLTHDTSLYNAYIMICDSY
jgi:hypothetical protein